jgi:hypothetical protein
MYYFSRGFENHIKKVYRKKVLAGEERALLEIQSKLSLVWRTNSI